MNNLSFSEYVPERGDIVWLDFDPTSGHEQRGRRPALVLSPAEYQRKTGLAVVCPVTSHAKGYPFEVAVPPGLPIHGAILSDHVRSLDFSGRNAEFAMKLDDGSVRTVSKLLGLLVGAE